MHPANRWLIGIVGSGLLASAAMWEGTVLKPYKDIGGVVTVCSGYTGKDIRTDGTYTKKECESLLKKELEETGKGVIACASRPMKENEYTAYTLFAYNVGVSGACNSRSMKLFNEGKVYEACNALAFSPSGTPAWSYVNGKFVQGLHNRRLFERDVCMGKRNVQS